MLVKKLLSDYLIVQLEPAHEKTEGGIIILHPEHEPVRLGKVLMAGPGRRYKDKLVPMPEDIIGKRVMFMIAASDARPQLSSYLDEGQRMIRLGDILVEVDHDVDIHATKRGTCGSF